MQHSELNIDSALKKEYSKIYENADNLFKNLSLFSIGITLILGFVYNNLISALILGIIHLSLFLLSFRFIQNRKLKIYVLGVIFGLWPVIFVPISNGFFLLNYAYFAYYILLIMYQENKLLIIGPFSAVIYNIGIFLSINLNIFKDFTISNFKNEGIYSSEELLWGIIVNLSVGASSYLLASLLSEKTHADIKSKIEQQEQIKVFERYKKFAIEIENNNLELQTDIKEEDYIGQSLNKIKQKLSDSIKKEETDKFLTNYNNSGIAIISEILRTPDLELKELSNLLVSEIVKYTNANLGAIFIAEEDINGNIYLDLKATYAYERRKYIDKKILPGEGIVGTAFIENQSVYLTKLPEGYLYLKSGLGETKPRALIAQTISYNEKTIGILEIASLKEFKEYELKFIKNISEFIASSIISEKAKTNTANLLEKSNNIATEMRIKEQELNEKIQELEVENLELQKKISKQNKVKQ